MAAFLVMLREGVEAALVVAILLAYLDRLGRSDSTRWVWMGTGAAAVASLVVGVALWATVGGLEGTAEELAEGGVAVAAAALLTWMIFWIGRRARDMGTLLRTDMDDALGAGGRTAVAAVAFLAVLREGFESALFMLSTTLGATSDAVQVTGGLVGLAAAVGIGVLLYQGRRVVDLRIFFRITGLLIVLFAAGLVAKGIHEFQELGALPSVVEHLWNAGVFDPETSTAGQFLSSLFGWDPDPSALMVLGYVTYLVPVAWAFHRMTRSPRREPVGA